MTRTIKLGGQTYTIEPVEGLLKDERAYGMVRYAEGLISVDADLTPSFELVVVLHEIIHVIQEQLGWKKDERTADGLAYKLIELLQNNRWLADVIIENATD